MKLCSTDFLCRCLAAKSTKTTQLTNCRNFSSSPGTISGSQDPHLSLKPKMWRLNLDPPAAVPAARIVQTYCKREEKQLANTQGIITALESHALGFSASHSSSSCLLCICTSQAFKHQSCATSKQQRTTHIGLFFHCLLKLHLKQPNPHSSLDAVETKTTI